MKAAYMKSVPLLLLGLFLSACRTLPVVPHAISCDVNTELLASNCAVPKPIPSDATYATLIDTMLADRKALNDCSITANALRDVIRRCNRATAEYNRKIDALNKSNQDSAN
jgi:hypothetical protein